MALFVAGFLSISGVAALARLCPESASALLSSIAAAVPAAGFRAGRAFDVCLCAAVGGWIPFTWSLVAVFGGTHQGTGQVVTVVIAWSAGYLALTELLSWGAATSGRAPHRIPHRSARTLTFTVELAHPTSRSHSPLWNTVSSVGPA